MANVFQAVGDAIGAAAGGAAGGVAGVVTTGLSAIDALIGRWKANPTDVMKHDEVITQIEAAREKDRATFELQLVQAQTKINELEAASADKFTSRPRPFILWVCGFGFALALLGGPFFTWGSAWIATGKPGPFPTPDSSLLFTTMGSLLGIGGYRTVEKLNGVSK